MLKVLNIFTVLYWSQIKLKLFIMGSIVRMVFAGLTTGWTKNETITYRLPLLPNNGRISSARPMFYNKILIYLLSEIICYIYYLFHNSSTYIFLSRSNYDVSLLCCIGKTIIHQLLSVYCRLYIFPKFFSVSGLFFDPARGGRISVSIRTSESKL